jgi:proline iminopeptidase
MNPKTFDSGYLPEKDGHQIWYSQYGNPQGIPVLVFHGGPGSKSKPKQAKGYDLELYRIITFDQRGCGKSLPAGETKNNTLDDLVADVERLRTHLSIETWFVAGGSWGSTLALAYAQEHQEQVKGLLLSSVFLARDKDIDWSFSKDSGVVRMFPDIWEQRLEFLNKFSTTPEKAATDLLEIIATGSESVIKEIVAGVNNWEGNLMNAFEDINLMDAEDVEESDIASARVFLHYEANKFFLKPNQLLDNLDSIKKIPTVIVHGRYDLLCPLDQMWELKKRLDAVETVILPTSNHRLTAEGGIARKLAFNYFLHRKTTILD